MTGVQTCALPICEAGADKNFSQAVFDLFFKDMDRSLREMGVGDLGVPKRIQKMGNVFFGLLAALSEAMDKNDLVALEGVLSRNVFGDDQSMQIQAMAEYLMRQDKLIAGQSADTITGGTIEFENLQ